MRDMNRVALTLARMELRMSLRMSSGNRIIFANEQGDQENSAYAARHMQCLGMGLQQVAERRQPERDACGGNGYFSDEVAHDLSLSRLRCEVKFSGTTPSKVKTYDLL